MPSPRSWETHRPNFIRNAVWRPRGGSGQDRGVSRGRVRGDAGPVNADLLVSRAGTGPEVPVLEELEDKARYSYHHFDHLGNYVHNGVNTIGANRPRHNHDNCLRRLRRRLRPRWLLSSLWSACVY